MAQEDLKAAVARLEEDNRRLRRLLEVKDVPREVRHRLRSTMSLLRSIVRRSAETRGDLQAYVAHLDDRIDAIARAQAAADARGSVDLHGIILDELLRYSIKEGEKLHLSGPIVSFQPRTGQLITLAIHELAVNAIEHGSLALPHGHLAIDWREEEVQARKLFTVIWKEFGSATAYKTARQGFGTELLTRTLRYEMAADTRLEFEADGARCSICFSLTDQIGSVQAA